jgi:hypothetical protein
MMMWLCGGLAALLLTGMLPRAVWQTLTQPLAQLYAGMAGARKEVNRGRYAIGAWLGRLAAAEGLSSPMLILGNLSVSLVYSVICALFVYAEISIVQLTLEAQGLADEAHRLAEPGTAIAMTIVAGGVFFGALLFELLGFIPVFPKLDSATKRVRRCYWVLAVLGLVLAAGNTVCMAVSRSSIMDSPPDVALQSASDAAVVVSDGPVESDLQREMRWSSMIGVSVLGVVGAVASHLGPLYLMKWCAVAVSLLGAAALWCIQMLIAALLWVVSLIGGFYLGLVSIFIRLATAVVRPVLGGRSGDLEIPAQPLGQVESLQDLWSTGTTPVHSEATRRSEPQQNPAAAPFAADAAHVVPATEPAQESCTVGQREPEPVSESPASASEPLEFATEPPTQAWNPWGPLPAHQDKKGTK